MNKEDAPLVLWARCGGGGQKRKDGDHAHHLARWDGWGRGRMTAVLLVLLQGGGKEEEGRQAVMGLVIFPGRVCRVGRKGRVAAVPLVRLIDGMK